MPNITLDGISLEAVDAYKYLGFQITTTLDPLKQWHHIHSNINSFPFLIKQLKRCGLEEKILITTYKSLVLSHFNYSSTILDSATAGTKQDMQLFQNRVLQIIGITK